MTAASTAYGCALAATALDGLLAGETVDRFIIGRSAWKRLGVLTWARYSREADLTLRGALIYPPESIGGTLLSIAAVLSILRGRRGRPAGALAPLAAAAVLSTAGLLVTTKAAPNMLRVRRLGDDTQGLQEAFDGFFRWSALRGALQVLAFGANLWSLAALRRSRR